MNPAILCDGCNVRNLWEHRCHKDKAIVKGVFAGKPCECPDCRESDRIFDEPGRNREGGD